MGLPQQVPPEFPPRSGIDNCRVKTSQSCLEFEREGAFRSWLVRLPIDEALARRKNRATIVNADEP
jgi:hypothetical protein